MSKGSRIAETIVRVRLSELIDECRKTDSRSRRNELLEFIPAVLKNLAGMDDQQTVAFYARRMGWSVKEMSWAIHNNHNQVIHAKAAQWILDQLPETAQNLPVARPDQPEVYKLAKKIKISQEHHDDLAIGAETTAEMIKSEAFTQ